MTRFMTVVTIFGLLIGFQSQKSYGSDLTSLQNITQTFTQFRQVVNELDTTYNNGQIKGDVSTLDKINVRAMETLKFCHVVEGKFQERAPEVLARKQDIRNRAIEKGQSLLDTADVNLKASQALFIANLETAKYCLGLTGQVRASIAQKLE